MTAVVTARLRRGNSRSRLGLGARAKTENVTRLPKYVLEAGRVHLPLVSEEPSRPLVRALCAGGHRPCPFVSCRHNLYLDVDESNGSIKVNFPDLEPEQVPPEKSCALDVADEGGGTLEDVAATMNVTRERVRQIESKALRRVRSRSEFGRGDAAELREYSDAPPGSPMGPRSDGQGSVFAPKVERAEPDEESEEDEPPIRVSFFAEPDSEDVDERVADAVWKMFARDSNNRGFDCRSSQSRAQSKRLAAERAAKGIVGTPPAPIETEEESEMTTDREAIVLKTYNALNTRLGRLPTNVEIADEIGDWATGDLVRKVRNDLVDKGLAKNRPRGGARPDAPKTSETTVKKARPAARRAARPKVAAAPRLAVETKPARTTSRDPVVASLITKRDELRRKADALDVAIEALSVAL